MPLQNVVSGRCPSSAQRQQTERKGSFEQHWRSGCVRSRCCRVRYGDVTEGPAPAWDSGPSSAPRKGAPRRKRSSETLGLHGRLVWQRGLEGPQASGCLTNVANFRGQQNSVFPKAKPVWSSDVSGSHATVPASSQALLSLTAHCGGLGLRAAEATSHSVGLPPPRLDVHHMLNEASGHGTAVTSCHPAPTSGGQEGRALTTVPGAGRRAEPRRSCLRLPCEVTPRAGLSV